MLSRIVAFSLILSFPVYSADDCNPIEIAPNVTTDLSRVSKALKVDCPNQVDVPRLCGAISNGLGQPDPKFKTKFAYQNLIYQASCVEAGDSAEIIRSKVQVFWNKFHPQLICNQIGFSVRDGHLLKLAVERDNQDFVEEALLDWKVGLNHVDERDHKTVLDYIDENLKKARGTSREATLKMYFDLFKENGAKFSRDV